MFRFLLLLLSSLLSASIVASAPFLHALSIHGHPRYDAHFSHFSYVNPHAPKGGVLRIAAMGNGYDTFNPFGPSGQAPPGIRLTYDTLLAPAEDEPSSQYGLVADGVRLAPDHSWIEFHIRKGARWHDGVPITAEDVAWSFRTLTTKGKVVYRFYYRDVASVRVEAPDLVRFLFRTSSNPELPFILGQFPILPRHYWKGRDFTQATTVPPLSSGPYKVETFEPNRYVVYKRVARYWGKDLPVNRGRFNVGHLRYDYYADRTVALRAFLAGDLDLRIEDVSKNWAIGYRAPAVRDGRILKKEFPSSLPSGMQGFAFNLRRSKFKNPLVRQALVDAFNFTWINRVFFFGLYKRSRSYFNASVFEAKGLPEGRELKILEPFRAQLPSLLFTTPYILPQYRRPGDSRRDLLKAASLLKQAGWHIDPKSLKLVDTKGRPFRIEILLVQGGFERVALFYGSQLKRLGIETRVRRVDSSQYINRLRRYAYDMVVASWPQSSSPGNEQKEFWGSRAADSPNSRNYTGIKSPVVDTLVERIARAYDRKSLIALTRALDRVLQWQVLVVPQWYTNDVRIAFWHQIHFPQGSVRPLDGIDLTTLWVQPS